MYEALVARVRYHIQKANFMGLKEAESTLLLGEAADAIEELQAAEKKYLANISALETENQHLKREREWMPVASTRDFNTVTSDLIRHLRLSCQRTDGEIWWYEGTLEVLVEFLSILHQKAEEAT